MTNIVITSLPPVMDANSHTGSVPTIQLLPMPLDKMAELVHVDTLAGSHEKLVWELAAVLFTAKDKSEPLLGRKDELSRFWENLVQKSVRASASAACTNEEKALACLSGHMIPEACKYLLDGGNFHLATLVSLVNSSENYRQDLRSQVQVWRRSRMLSEFSMHIRAIYEILGGNVGISEGLEDGAKEDRAETFVISRCMGLDWQRAFGLRLWYGTKLRDDISAAIADFQADMEAGHEHPPLPWYHQSDSQADNARQGLLWGLLQLYRDPRVGIDSMINPENARISPIDSRLAWQLGVALSSQRDVGAGSDGLARMDPLTTSYGSQLIKEGDWLGAIFVLLHLSAPLERVRSIKDLLARQAGAIGPESGEVYKTLTTDLQIPQEWVWEAKALYMRDIQGDHEAETRCWIRAGDFTQAHRVLLDRVAPNAVVELRYSTLRNLLDHFRGHELSIEGWSRGGGVYSIYMIFAQLQARGAEISDDIITKLRAHLPTLHNSRAVSAGGEHMKNAAIASMAEAVADVISGYVTLSCDQNVDSIGVIGEIPLTSDSRLRYSMDQSWQYFTKIIHF
jgi:nuclear pore complex protein Nup98-Nup96